MGGSWGATLGLAYAEQYPERVSGIVPRATFLGTRAELELDFAATLQRIFPPLHADSVGVLPEAERGAVLDSYWRRILDPDPAIHRPAAIAWHDTERALSMARSPLSELDRAALAETTGPLPSTPFIEAHYFVNDCFLAPNQLLRRAGSLRGIPGIIVQGECDHLWPDADVQIIPDAGHALSDPAIAAAVNRNRTICLTHRSAFQSAERELCCEHA